PPSGCNAGASSPPTGRTRRRLQARWPLEGSARCRRRWLDPAATGRRLPSTARTRPSREGRRKVRSPVCRSFLGGGEAEELGLVAFPEDVLAERVHHALDLARVGRDGPDLEVQDVRRQLEVDGQL